MRPNVILGGLIVIILFVLGIYGVEMGLPYLFHRSSLPWAAPASNRSSLIGLWVGKVNVTTASSQDAVTRPATGITPAAVLFKVELDFMWGTPKIKGFAQVCTAGGVQETSAYELEPMHDPSNFEVLLHQEGASTTYTHLKGYFTPGSLRIEWPFRSEDDFPSPHPSGASGILHKGDASEFAKLCNNF